MGCSRICRYGPSTETQTQVQNSKGGIKQDGTRKHNQNQIEFGEVFLVSPLLSKKLLVTVLGAMATMDRASFLQPQQLLAFSLTT